MFVYVCVYIYVYESDYMVLFSFMDDDVVITVLATFMAEND